MKKVGVIFGSRDSEREVSIDSAKSLLKNFPVDSYQYIPIYIDENGQWLTGDFTIEDLEKRDFSKGETLYLTFNPEKPFYNLNKKDYLELDAVFLMLHGRTGEGGLIQGLLEVAQVPYTGCSSLSSGLCMDKAYTHMIAESVNIPMANYQRIEKDVDRNSLVIEYPCIVKPSREGSSFGVTYVEDASKIDSALDEAFKYDDKIIIERYIKGVEVGVGILDIPTENRRIISNVDQVNFTGPIFDYQEKYHPHTIVTLPESTFPNDVLDQVKNYANKIYDVMECNGFARIDFFVNDNHEIFFNEVNTIPGFTETSRYPKMMQGQGISYSELIKLLIDGALYNANNLE